MCALTCRKEDTVYFPNCVLLLHIKNSLNLTTRIYLMLLSEFAKMALSNVFREPRKELTEQAVGFAAIIGVIGGLAALAALILWPIAAAIQHFEPAPKDPLPACMLVATLLIVGSGMVILMLTFFVHFIGEEICDSFPQLKRLYQKQ